MGILNRILKKESLERYLDSDNHLERIIGTKDLIAMGIVLLLGQVSLSFQELLPQHIVVLRLLFLSSWLQLFVLLQLYVMQNSHLLYQLPEVLIHSVMLFSVSL